MFFIPSFWMAQTSDFSARDFWDVGNSRGGITSGGSCDGSREAPQGESLQRFLSEEFIQKKCWDQNHRETLWLLCSLLSGIFSHLPLLPLPALCCAFSPTASSLSFPLSLSTLLSLPPCPLWMCISPSSCGNTGQIAHLQRGENNVGLLHPSFRFQPGLGCAHGRMRGQIWGFQSCLLKMAWSGAGLTSAVVFKSMAPFRE